LLKKAGLATIAVVKLHINGEDKTYDSPVTLATLISRMGLKADRVAVELNLSIVPREL
jgi:thiamine biosynthesis protein ThiS